MDTHEGGGSPAPDGGHTTEAHAAHSDSSMFFSICAYLGILIVIPFFAAKDDPIVKFHIKQGGVLFVLEVIVAVIGWAVWILWPILAIIKLALLVLSILGIINAVQHKQKELPLVGQYAKHIKI